MRNQHYNIYQKALLAQEQKLCGEDLFHFIFEEENHVNQEQENIENTLLELRSELNSALGNLEYKLSSSKKKEAGN